MHHLLSSLHKQRHPIASLSAELGDEWHFAYWARKCGIPRDRVRGPCHPADEHGLHAAEWIDRCVARLRQLRPHSSPIQALTDAVSLWETHARLLPEQAAERAFSNWPQRVPSLPAVHA